MRRPGRAGAGSMDPRPATPGPPAGRRRLPAPCASGPSERAYRGPLGGAYAPAVPRVKEADVYGTVGRMKVKPGKMQEVRDNMLDPQGAAAPFQAGGCRPGHRRRTPFLR